MTRLASLLFAGALVAGAASQPETYTGVITDTMCGKDHAAMKITPNERCVRECARHDSKYALYDGKNMYVLSDQKTPEQLAGQKVTVTGTLYRKTNILKVDSIEAQGGAGHSGHQH